jgi:transposase
METMGKKKPRPRRSFTSEFKAEIVELCQRGDRTLPQVCNDFDLVQSAVRGWVQQAERDAASATTGRRRPSVMSCRSCAGRTGGFGKTSRS